MTWPKRCAVVARHAGNGENQTMLFRPKKSEYKCTIRHRVHVPCPFGLNKKHNNNTTMPLFRFHFFCLSSTLFRIVCGVCLCVCICLFVDVPCSVCLLLKGKRKFYALHVISFLFRSLA